MPKKSDFPEEKRTVPQVDMQVKRNPKLPATKHANYEFLPCKLEEALLCCSISKVRPRFPWNSKGYLTCFSKPQKFPQIPVHTQKEC